jgi:hypothetical protein
LGSNLNSLKQSNERSNVLTFFDRVALRDFVLLPFFDLLVTGYYLRFTIHDSEFTIHDARFTLHDSRLTIHSSLPTGFTFAFCL